MKAAANGPDRNIQNRRNLLVAMLLQVFQDHDGPMFGRQRRQGLPDLFLTLAPIKHGAGIGIPTRIDWVRGGVGKAFMIAEIKQTRTSAAMSADREIDCDPVNPCVEGACSLKLIELDVRTHERILENVARVFLRAE